MWHRAEREEATMENTEPDPKEAMQRAEALLDRVRAQRNEVSALSRIMRIQRMENHLAERIAETFGRHL